MGGSELRLSFLSPTENLEAMRKKASSIFSRSHPPLRQGMRAHLRRRTAVQQWCLKGIPAKEGRCCVHTNFCILGRRILFIRAYVSIPTSQTICRISFNGAQAIFRTRIVGALLQRTDTTAVNHKREQAHSLDNIHIPGSHPNAAVTE